MATVLERVTIPERDALDALPMPKRPLGRTGWNASLLTLGGVKWCDLPDAEAVRVIHRALDLGVNTLDTAWAYGHEGASEKKMGLALRGRRQEVFLSTKVIDRTYDGAKRQIEQSLERLGVNQVDLMFVHSMDTEHQYHQILAANSVLKAVEEYRAAGHVRFVGVSGHFIRDVMARILTEYPWDAVLFPIGLFNLAYEYNFADVVLPVAQARGLATLGMKVFAAGRIKHVRSILPYVRYSANLPVHTCVIGADSVAQVEENVRAFKGDLPPLTDAEIEALKPEIFAVTREWDSGEFPWLHGYPKWRERHEKSEK